MNSHPSWWDRLIDRTYYPVLAGPTRSFLFDLARRYWFTFQEFRKLTEIARDLEMWEEDPFPVVWQRLEITAPASLADRSRKEHLLKNLYAWIDHLRQQPTPYPPHGLTPTRRRPLKVVYTESERKIFGTCPVASEKTVCCNLKTIDAVLNCAFACSYCTIQTFYGDRAVFDRSFPDKLDSVELDPHRFYHFTTGQASDSLAWGNRYGILDHLCAFAARHPNILLEFKTKSANIGYFLDHPVPPNVVCSWSLNTATIIRNEEHGTADLEERLQAALAVVRRGILVAFHFHPLVYYQNGDREYPALVRRILELFSPDDVLFVSFGSVTFIKPVLRAMRLRGERTRIHQMEMVPDPHGKLTYPDPIKISLYRRMYEAFEAWHDRVYFYLCMERADIWDAVFGWHYPDNDTFERDFGRRVMEKVRKRARATHGVHELPTASLPHLSRSRHA